MCERARTESSPNQVAHVSDAATKIKIEIGDALTKKCDKQDKTDTFDAGVTGTGRQAIAAYRSTAAVSAPLRNHIYINKDNGV